MMMISCDCIVGSEDDGGANDDVLLFRIEALALLAISFVVIVTVALET